MPKRRSSSLPRVEDWSGRIPCTERKADPRADAQAVAQATNSLLSSQNRRVPWLSTSIVVARATDSKAIAAQSVFKPSRLIGAGGSQCSPAEDQQGADRELGQEQARAIPAVASIGPDSTGPAVTETSSTKASSASANGKRGPLKNMNDGQERHRPEAAGRGALDEAQCQQEGQVAGHRAQPRADRKERGAGEKVAAQPERPGGRCRQTRCR